MGYQYEILVIPSQIFLTLKWEVSHYGKPNGTLHHDGREQGYFPE